MKTIYFILLRSIAMTVVMFSAFSISAQDIHFTFGNPKNTDDGSFDYYEVDVFIQTINTTGSFKLGSGQLYFNYNTAAFGTHVFSNSNVEVTSPNAEGYIAGQLIDGVNSEAYGRFTINDNKASRVSWSFFQLFNSNTFVANNVTDIPTKLCHLKFRYINANEKPMLEFEDGNVFDDQFVTACGNFSDDIYCTEQVGLELLNDTFNSDGTRLPSELEQQNSIKLHPNPVKDMLTINGNLEGLKSVELYSISGQLILNIKSNFDAIDMNKMEAGVYLIKFRSIDGVYTFKVIKE